jgi:hypothetical protein
LNINKEQHHPVNQYRFDGSREPLPVITLTFVLLNCLIYVVDRKFGFFGPGIVFGDLAMRPPEVIAAIYQRSDLFPVVTLCTVAFYTWCRTCCSSRYLDRWWSRQWGLGDLCFITLPGELQRPFARCMQCPCETFRRLELRGPSAVCWGVISCFSLLTD